MFFFVSESNKCFAASSIIVPQKSNVSVPVTWAVCVCVFCILPSVCPFTITRSVARRKRRWQQTGRGSLANCYCRCWGYRCLGVHLHTGLMGREGKGRDERRSDMIHKSLDKIWIDLYGRKCTGNIKSWDLIGWNNLKNVTSEYEVYCSFKVWIHFGPLNESELSIQADPI